MTPSSHSRPSSRESSSSASSVAWVISFGDLLTLLLCFFLVLTPWDRLSAPPKTKESQMVAAQLPLQVPAGTSLAPQPARAELELLAAVPVHAGLVSSQDGVGEARLLAAIEDALRPHAKAGRLVMRVVVCPSASGTVPRSEVLARVLPIAASRGFSQVGLEVEAAAGCGEPQQAEGEVVVGRVNILRM